MEAALQKEFEKQEKQIHRPWDGNMLFMIKERGKKKNAEVANA